MADPNLTTHRKKTTPLHLVARSNDSSLDILKALIVFNADLNLRDAKGMSALHLLGENTAPWAREGIAVMHAVKAARYVECVLILTKFWCRIQTNVSLCTCS